ncbi:prepilin-type N-terminal cleavage/methylation domain-containing protein [Campylobacter devanensis]|uniref:Uncharacterized protein n=1 Tax=Campylobacter devanensis TaxID=3161138 RepID=A0A1X9SSE9_9BACT|nr:MULTISPECIES: hypothetical protein [Campylobacter]ARQ99155.1 hypothetical protein CIGN_0868 [Campylobacter lanienae]SUX02338.1 prepilin-type N-terminal cleavage/methylation domain-containing protein [Campylobacter lanienae]
MRYAFSSLELILSIIIVAIALSSLPSILQISVKSTNDAILSEAVTASYTKLSNIIAHPWNDAISPSLAQPIYYSSELPLNSLTSRVISKITPNKINTAKNSINGFNGDSGLLKPGVDSKNLLNLEYAISVGFINDFKFTTNTTKNPADAIAIKLTTKANTKPIIFYSYSYNIGEPLIRSLIIPSP